SGSTDKFFLELQSSALKTVDTMTRRLRLGPLSRSPHAQRRPGGAAMSGLPQTWQGNPHLKAVVRHGKANPNNERRFEDLLRRERRATHGKPIAAFSSLPECELALAAIEASDGALFGTSDNAKGGSGAEEATGIVAD